MNTADNIEAVSCVRESMRSVHIGLGMLDYAPDHQVIAAVKDIERARAQLLRARRSLEIALGKIAPQYVTQQTKASAMRAALRDIK